MSVGIAVDLSNRPFVVCNMMLEYGRRGTDCHLVFKEALRLYPPASGTARVISKNTTICGYPISQETNISISFYCIQRSPSYWHDPLQFNPDRFHEGESNNLQAFMPFSVGNRSCLGHQFAEMEVKILFAKIF